MAAADEGSSMSENTARPAEGAQEATVDPAVNPHAEPATTQSALPISGAALVDEEDRAVGGDAEGSILPPPRLEGTQPGGAPAQRMG